MMNNRLFLAVFSFLSLMPSWALGNNSILTNNLSAIAEDSDVYTLTLVSSPTDGGWFYNSTLQLAAGERHNVATNCNQDFVFINWTMGDSVLSTDKSFYFDMPAHDTLIVAHFEYNPVSPVNPNANYWNSQTGEIIIDDFTPGRLGDAISAVISGSSNDEVKSIIVSGIINNNDVYVANSYTGCEVLDFSRVSGVTEVPTYAFSNTNLQNIYLPSIIEKIASRAFDECKQLSSLTIYAMTPPALESNVFKNVPEELVVYVPATAIAQYQDAEGWKDLTMLPIQEDIRNITVSLPEGVNPADYAQMWLELTNTKNGQRIHYVMTDRSTYTFMNIIRNTSWNVTLRNERGDVFGQIENVEVKDEDVSVVFSKLSKPQNVVLAVQTPNGQDVTDQAQITWTDAEGNYVAQGTSLSGLPIGYQANYRVALSQDLAMQYDTPQAVEYVLKDGHNNIVCQLMPIKQIKISGKVREAETNLPLSGAIISASQTFAGKYSKTLNAKADNKGEFVLEVANVPTSVAFSATDYISQTMVCDSLLNDEATVVLPVVSLKPISGAVISLDLNYTACVADGEEAETQNWYSDYQNVSYSVYNVTKKHTITQFNEQYPQIVLLDDVDDGDVLCLIASSRTNSFMPVETTATIVEQKATASFDIKELGKIQSSFVKTDNASVVGSLYDASGKLVKTYDYLNASITINNLTDGRYTLVSMGSSPLFNTIYDLSQLPQTGLTKGSDYVQNQVDVKSGMISNITIAEVPKLDENKLYCTGNNTSFAVNKPSIVAGNYLTLTGHIDFKPAYASKVSNVRMVVDLPESCQFVENSVMVGNSTSSYILNGHQITIPLARYTDRVRFCVIPTLGGDYAPSAFAQFDLNGETITQPIGSTYFHVRNINIFVPSVISKTAFSVHGTAVGKSQIDIYDNEVLIGQTTTLPNGNWATVVELDRPYNGSLHAIHANVTSERGTQVQTETKFTVYDVNAIQVSKVTMFYNNPELHTNYELVYDFLAPSTTPLRYTYCIYNRLFSFTIDFTDNDPSLISDVVLYVKTGDGKWNALDATFDDNLCKWVASGEFGNMFDGVVPMNVSVDFASTEIEQTLSSQLFDDMTSDVTDGYEEYKVGIDDIESQISVWRQKVEAANSDVELLQSLNEEAEVMVNAIAEKYDLNFETDIDEGSWSEEELQASEEEDYDRICSFIDELNANLDKFKELFNYESDIESFDETIGALAKSTTCYGLTPESLLADGYELMKTDDNDIFYMKFTPDTIAYANFTKNIYQILILSKMNEALDNLAKRSPVSWDAITSVAQDLRDLLQKIEANRQEIITLINEIRHYSAADMKYRFQDFCQLAHRIGNDFSEIVGYATDFINLAKEKLFTPVRIMQDAQIVLYRELGLARAHEKVSIDVIKKSKWGFVAAQLTVLSAPLNFILSQKWVISVGKFLVKYATPMNIVYACAKVASRMGEVIAVLSDIFPCEDDWGRASLIIDNGSRLFVNIAAFGIAAIGTEVYSDYLIGGASASIGVAIAFVVLKVLAQWGLDKLSNWSFDTEIWDLKKEMAKLECDKEDEPEEDKNEMGAVESGYPDNDVPLDPSGYVYEAVFSNRLDGACATVFYKEEIEDIYGDLHENIVKWDAAEYAQENPLFTDENGYYRWDVPQGLWQVKFEKEGYETTYSEWLPVPPPQLDINIAMTQNRQPEVKAARAYEDAVEVEFDKYMMPEFLTIENISVMQAGKPVDGSIILLDEETSYEGETETFASKVRFNAVQPFSEKEVTILVNNRVKSYAGIRMQDNFMQTFSTEQEIKQIICDSLTTVGYGEYATMMISVLPSSASKGKTLHVINSSPQILGIETETMTIGNDGGVELVVSGQLPGIATLTISLEGTDKTATAIVKVVKDDYQTVATPTASIASGTVVEKGTKVQLFCATEGATIYYTLDGSCPCDDTDGRMIYDGTPIVINKSIIIKAMAVHPDMYESKVAEFVYSVEGDDAIKEVTISNQLRMYPIPVHDDLNIYAGGEIINSVIVSSMDGIIIAVHHKPSTRVTLDLSDVAKGFFIVNVMTEHDSFSRKIIKE